jgi:hypothetical protein
MVKYESLSRGLGATPWPRPGLNTVAPTTSWLWFHHLEYFTAVKRAPTASWAGMQEPPLMHASYAMAMPSLNAAASIIKKANA